MRHDSMDGGRYGPSRPSRGITPSLEGRGRAKQDARAEGSRVYGFTLVETVVTIAIMGILLSIVAVFLVRPIEGYRDLSRRAALVEAAESALQRMRRDIRSALPNSVRITNTASGYALELIPVLDAARYTAQQAAALNDEELDVTGTDDQFDVQHCFRNTTTATTASIRIVINNLATTTSNNAYTAPAGPNTVITPISTAVTISSSATCPTSGFAHVTLNPGYNFLGHSNNRRLYVVTQPLSYLCDTAGGTLTRYYNYPITATQPTTAAGFVALNASSALATDRVTACSVTTTTSDVRNRAIVTLSLTLGESGEEIRLVHQVQTDNTR